MFASRGGKGILLPMEVCEIFGGQRYIKRLDEKQTTCMISLNNQTPRDREAYILEMVHQNDYAKDRYTQEFGINMSETASSIQARILPSPQINYNGTPFQPRSGQWNMINQNRWNQAQLVEQALVTLQKDATTRISDGLTVVRETPRKLNCRSSGGGNV